ncbi:ABC transporter permease [Thalassovita aquimarina]|uniref:ABC transporter permease n=1 Tax=Thalassovita aquimarina TaxID=2785917 RepID=UPI003568A55D
MSLGVAARLARRELRGGLKGFRIFLACLVMGVAAIAGIGSIRSGIEAGLAREGAALLGGDAEMEFTYRFASEAERGWMEARALAVSEVADFRSMAVAGEARALTQVKAVDDAYPLVGAVELAPEMPLEQALAGRQGLPGAVLDPLLISQLGAEIGDTFRLGTQDFVLSAALTREPDGAADGFMLGPRSLVRSDDLTNSGLLAPGTLYSTKYRLDLPEGADLPALERQAKASFEDSGLRWRDARNGTPGIATFVDRLGAFLILVGLSGLAVGGVGVSSAVRAYLAGKTQVIATLRSLGADQKLIFQIYFLQIGALSALGIVLGVLLGGGVPMLLGPLIRAQLPVPADFALYPAPLAEAAVYGALTALIFTLWPLARTGEVRAATLFRDAMAGARALPPWRYVLITAALTGVLIAVAMLFSGTWTLTLWTAGGVMLALFALALAAAGLRRLARACAPLARGRAAWRWALAAIGAARDEATPVVLSLGLGLTVLAAVGQIDGNLRGAIARDLPDKAPSFFFVDIQKDQVGGFLTRLQGDDQVSRIEHAPMLRGVITKINGQPAKDVAGDHWVLHGDRGVTYAGAQPENTKVTAGEWWGADYTGPPQISFAAEEAAEMGLGLGDNITINILGRDITGTVTSFREVDFSTAGMGFILAMNEAALAGAPHSFIATVYATEAAEAAILNDLTSSYPNITAIRVRDAIDRVSGLLDGIAAATSWGAAATLLTGFLVLIGAAAAGAPARRYEAAVLKTLGATRGRILTSFALRAALLGAGAALVALAAGIAGGWAVMHFVMDTGFAVIWPSALGIVAGGVMATLLAGIGFAWAALNARPVATLRGRE